MQKVSEVKNIGIPKDLMKEVVIRTLRSRVEETNHKLKEEKKVLIEII